jgi:hypothetical protein
MKCLEQGLLNLGAAGLYHVVEQRLAFYIRTLITGFQELQAKKFPATKKQQEVRSKFLKQAGKKIYMCGMIKLLNEVNVDVTRFASWNTVEELELVANTVKHASEDASKELRQRRPHLFEVPEFYPPKLSVVAPLAGDDFFVKREDFKRYGESVVQFFGEFADAIRAASF